MTKSMKMAPADDKIDVTSLKLSDKVRQGKSFESKALWISPSPSQPMLTFLLHCLPQVTRTGLEFRTKVVED